jgi:hypothetical protein
MFDNMLYVDNKSNVVMLSRGLNNSTNNYEKGGVDDMSVMTRSEKIKQLQE